MEEANVRAVAAQMIEEFRGTLGEQIAAAITGMQTATDEKFGTILKKHIDDANALAEKLKVNSDLTLNSAAESQHR